MLKKVLIVGAVATTATVLAMAGVLAVVMFLEAKGLIEAGPDDEDIVFDIFSLETFKRL